MRRIGSSGSWWWVLCSARSLSIVRLPGKTSRESIASCVCVCVIYSAWKFPSAAQNLFVELWLLGRQSDKNEQLKRSKQRVFSCSRTI